MTGVYSVPTIIRKGDWGMKLDITQAYYHVAMAARSCPYLRSVQEVINVLAILDLGLSRQNVSIITV